ncbi:MAG: ATP-dependent RNA helicase HrpA [Desulfobacterales bacterium]
MTTIRSRIRGLEALLPDALARDRAALRNALARLKRAGGAGLPTRTLEGIEARLAASVAARARRRRNAPVISFPEKLPITAKKDEIIAAIRHHPVVVVSGDTGSGKSTQIPKFCLAAGRGIDGLIGHTQPRRIAAQAVARRIAEEMGQGVGQAVGFKVRFQDTTSPDAYIKVMTDGILLAETAGDRMLGAYDTLIVDEAHERSLNIDFILGYLRTLIRRRRDLRLIITSATIDTAKFSRAFGEAPVIEVSGRSYPVEVRYEPPEAASGGGDLTPVEQAAGAVRRILQERRAGDILVFMPTEQDIRETCETIAGAGPPGTLVLPLFARLTAAEQNRVFHPAAGRKIIVATNVAETSLTIPGITFVVDTGLARIPRYSPRTRTTAMPVVPVSRSSADQRKGRCGRVAQGVCIRLYSEEDYLGRSRYTPPEILRANLAEVILRMLALDLGAVGQFPFIDPPDAGSIADGFRLLSELGAIEEGRPNPAGGGAPAVPDAPGGRAARLTATGRLMARIPLDPRLTRMLIEAREEGCVEEIAVLAAVLSLQDPRERPADKTAEADRVHAAFNRPHSDFMTLLQIWARFRQARRELKSAGPMRRFCRRHFLSFRRMREWEDVFRQIMEVAHEFGILKKAGAVCSQPGENRKLKRDAESDDTFPLAGAEFGKIHRCILSGFLANIAFKKDKNLYRAAKEREAMIFPGSAVFNSAGSWIVAAEMVETSRLFARTVATIDPGWLERLGGSLCRSTHRDPRWDPRRGEVVATEQVTLFGLVIVPGRSVSYGNIRPEEATELFIRQALVEGRIGKPYAFLQHNQALSEHVADLESRLRRRDLLVGEEALAAFYRERLGHVCDLRALDRLIKTKGGDGFLRMSEEDLMHYRPDEGELSLFPERVEAAGQTLALGYCFKPGSDADGVTLRVPAALAPAVPPEAVEWLVPGLLRERVETLLRGLPKPLRRRLVPLGETVGLIVRELPQGKGAFLTALGEFIHRRLGVDIPASAWPAAALPDHLKMRLAITAPDGRELASGRDPALLRSQFAQARIPLEVRRRWERSGLTRWDFGDLPETLVGEKSATSLWTAYPALEPGAEGVNLRLFSRRAQAAAVHPRGVAALFAIHFSKDLKFLKRSLALPEEVHPAARYFGGARRLEEAMADRVVQELFATPVRTEREFAALAAAGGQKILPAGRGLLYALIPVIQSHATARRELAALAGGRGPLAALSRRLDEEACHLLPQNFLALYEAARFPHLERYLQALALRARRALVDPEKERAKSANLQPFSERLRLLLKTLRPETSVEKRRAVEELFWLIEEYKVSLFAQELKTAVPVSAKRLEERSREIERMG